MNASGLVAACPLAAEAMACNMMTDDAAHGIDCFMAKKKPRGVGDSFSFSRSAPGKIGAGDTVRPLELLLRQG